MTSIIRYSPDLLNSTTLMVAIHINCQKPSTWAAGVACFQLHMHMRCKSDGLLQGSLHGLRDDISNRVEYAVWQQRQAHEASLGQIYQQHAQELQAAVSHANVPMLPDEPNSVVIAFPVCMSDSTLINSTCCKQRGPVEPTHSSETFISCDIVIHCRGPELVLSSVTNHAVHCFTRTTLWSDLHLMCTMPCC